MREGKREVAQEVDGGRQGVRGLPTMEYRAILDTRTLTVLPLCELNEAYVPSAAPPAP